ncbi:MAG: protein-export membrane protein SecF [Candidatus Liptonbacteria bacterium RIFCSPLOWO2_01_FULL_56_20]|uniref:Protein-export membrane protein SecF n=1 Tax=Candidatus Liptonbacteria bacterium RIFCSPLOWO2_01_FULL_56_20 TaxID=1798652 RepID=A0A1G2CI03_9BACT|nr:MAG: protein-export membrane protein SecF [Candidatus Liptonbacteria bacterium RIFCSPHIGHO2_01_FULL_56_18b]OGZ01015.1 MAG: protein-export membrane protein SecF [Candidatus Liptonbacteria bacterium RIFCSPLOWO2_01_FULL_56_20]
MNIVGHKKIFLTISVALIAAAVIVIVAFGFRAGIDFNGGTLWRFAISGSEPSMQDLEATFTSDLGVSEVRVNYDSGRGNFLARLPAITEQDHQKFLDLLTGKYPAFSELSFQSIGPSVGAELKRRSLIAIGLVLVGISLYIAFAFRKVYRPVSSWKYGWVTLASLLHDVLIPAGLLAILGRFARVEIDTNFVVALLVIAGFSVHDTIVVFDRIRENLFLDRGKTGFGEIVNQSINQTLARSINTSLTLILVLLALYFTGPANLHYFVLTLLVGVTTGIYSSIFMASPLLLVWQQWSARRGK